AAAGRARRLLAACLRSSSTGCDPNAQPLRTRRVLNCRADFPPSGRPSTPPVKRILPLILLALALPSTAHASAQQITTFEAPRELLSASTRDATLDQITAFGVTHVRQLVYWRDVAPAPDSRTKPAGFDASDPNP